MSVEQNIAKLQKQVFLLGHGNKYHSQIDENVRQGLPSFEIRGKEEYYQGTRRMSTVLNYRKGKEDYFFNSYDCTLLTPQGKETKQKFYVEHRQVNNPDTKQKEWRTIGFTTKESCNLLDSDDEGNSRAVCKVYYNKDGDPYMAWKKLDLNRTEKGNHPYESFQVYDIKKVIAKHNFSEDLDEVVESLCKGNRHAVTDPKADKENSRRFIVADPATQDIFIYDKSNKLIYRNDQKVESGVVIFRQDKDMSQGQEKPNVDDTNVTQQQSIPVNAQSVTEQNKDQLVSTGTTNQSQGDMDKSKSKDKGKNVGDKPLMEKGAKKLPKKEKAKNENAPTKNAPSRGNASDGELMGKNRNSSKNKSVGI